MQIVCLFDVQLSSKQFRLILSLKFYATQSTLRKGENKILQDTFVLAFVVREQCKREKYLDVNELKFVIIDKDHVLEIHRV